MVSNNVTKRRQDGLKIGTRAIYKKTFEVRKLYFKLDSFDSYVPNFIYDW